MARGIEIGLILGSARQGRFCDVVANWAADRIWADPRFSLSIVDPAQADEERNRVLARVDAFVVVTPEYNHGYAAPLKALIDAYHAEWRAKPVAFVSYGGVSGGLRAVEQLRLVFAELHTVAIRDGVSFANAQRLFDADGQLTGPGREPAETALDLMLSRLDWWAQALRAAREAFPYDSAIARRARRAVRKRPVQWIRRMEMDDRPASSRTGPRRMG